MIQRNYLLFFLNQGWKIKKKKEALLIRLHLGDPPGLISVT